MSYDIFNAGSFLMLVLMAGIAIFMGATGRLASLVPAGRVLEQVRGELEQQIKVNEDLQADNKGLHHTVRVLAAQGAEMTYRITQQDAELAALRVERDTLARRNAVLELAFENRAPPVGPTQKLRETLISLFSDGELKQLCTDLKVDYESLEGDGKESKALSLVSYFERRGEVNALTNMVRKLRPNARWM